VAAFSPGFFETWIVTAGASTKSRALPPPLSCAVPEHTGWRVGTALTRATSPAGSRRRSRVGPASPTTTGDVRCAAQKLSGAHLHRPVARGELAGRHRVSSARKRAFDVGKVTWWAFMRSGSSVTRTTLPGPPRVDTSRVPGTRLSSILELLCANALQVGGGDVGARRMQRQ